MTGLTSLSLENNKIQKLFVGVGQLTLLSELLLDYNELQTLPRTVANLTNLTKLSLAHNKIKHMTEWLLPRLPLRALNACDNLIQELPYSLLKFTKMTALNVDMNPFTDPPREVVVAGQKQIFRYLKMLQEASSSNTLDLTHLGLLKFPVMHCEMTTLTALKLDYNLLEALPKDSADCPEELDLVNCDTPGLAVGDLCESDGECGTDKSIDNCRNEIHKGADIRSERAHV